MCGRFTLTTDTDVLAEVFDLTDAATGDAVPRRFNIAPTDPVAVIRADPTGLRSLSRMRWGLVPRWADSIKIGARMINARAETVHKVGAFKHAYRRRRCLVAADGWYEWRKMPDGKQPFRFVRPDRRPFGMAGLWEEWADAGGEILESCTVITVAPNPVAAEVHDRMPLILPADAYQLWLDPEMKDTDRLTPLLKASPAEQLVYYPVDRRVNSVRNDDETCVEEIELVDAPKPPEQGSLF